MVSIPTTNSLQQFAASPQTRVFSAVPDPSSDRDTLNSIPNSTNLSHPSSANQSTTCPPHDAYYRQSDSSNQHRISQNGLPPRAPQRFESAAPMPTAPLKASKGVRKPKQKGGKSTAGRGNGFSKTEVDSLLDVLEEHLPIGAMEWDKVARIHSSRFPSTQRNADSLKRKFSSLHRQTGPTGDPTIPQEVKKAKAIREAMKERADLGDGTEQESDVHEGTHVNSIVQIYQPNDCNHAYVNEERQSLDRVLEDPFHIGVTDSEVPETARTPPSKSITPRPLVLKRNTRANAGKRESQSTEQDLIELYRMNMLHEQSRRDDEYRMRMIQREEHRERREEERREREKERHVEKLRREEERERAEEDGRRQKNFMRMMMLAMFRGQDLDNVDSNKK
ncbi:hypothetical protein BWQ96_04293 [Gracilariopsis chorda]|uniref:DUF6818 domain-containing protein n=1 Tax=Gracilariopsis chorda TaxID=448386 RepID=A0A2V3IUY6_9FLOR|nr:hypothetical protein BWQ96_04293 [Gracilariopsis chorda]|eukprot:PXF45932.1 hypothetical protein BWQ96_04293 [Gracilariopsis chorda]